jgi:acyl carrier protein
VNPAPVEIAAEIRRIVREQLELDWHGSDAEELASALDSLALLSLVVAVEDRFRITITEEDGASARSLSDLALVVARKLEQRPSPPGAPAPAEGASP